MSIGSRVLLAAKATVSKALDRMADPREGPDQVYQRQAGQLTRLQRRAVEAELVAQRDFWHAEAERFTAACERLTGEADG